MHDMPEHTTKTARDLTVGDIFKSNRRRAIVRSNDGERITYSLLRKNGEPSNPVYVMRNVDHEVEMAA